ncbi:hypothetical protein K501DRAFT_275530 [Backusella circina FSU 941]|nr:hypothetical protein K501DRAFT_275530 [Backusella circina FSU 941]
MLLNELECCQRIVTYACSSHILLDCRSSSSLNFTSEDKRVLPMYNPHVKDWKEKERERLRNIWEPSPFRSGYSGWRSGSSTSRENNNVYAPLENYIDGPHMSSNGTINHYKYTCHNDIDFSKLSNGLSTPSTVPSDTLTPFVWSQYDWFPSDTLKDNAGSQDPNDLPFTQAMIKQEASGSQDKTIDSLNALVGSLHVSNYGSMTTHGVSSPKTDSLWFSTTPLLDSNEVIQSDHRWLTDSIGFIRCNPFYSLECALKQDYMVIKIENIPWLVSAKEIKKEFGRFILPSPDKLEHTIHVMMDTSTGKTDSKAFLQVVDCSYNRKLLEEGQTNHIIHCRRIKISICPQDEFLRALYPSWPGTFQDGKALLSENNDKHPIFITQRELQGLGNVCRNYKLHFNRKSGERPFFYMKSLVLNLPWHQEHIVTTAQRDILYESYKIMAKYLAYHSTKQHTPFDADTIKNFVRPVLGCCGFTPKQRRAILHEADAECPPEMAYAIKDPILPQLEAE